MSRKCSDRCKRAACNEELGAHSAKTCKEACELCAVKGHDAWYCQKRCTLCRRDAHLPEECPIICSLCGAEGQHRVRACPWSYQNRNRNATGADKVVEQPIQLIQQPIQQQPSTTVE